MSPYAVHVWTNPSLLSLKMEPQLFFFLRCISLDSSVFSRREWQKETTATIIGGRKGSNKNVSATYHAMSLTHCVVDDGDDDVERDVRVNDDAMNVHRMVLMWLNHSNRLAVIDMNRAHSYRLHLKIRHFARLSTQILIILATQLYWIQPILMIISVLIALSFCMIYYSGIRYVFFFQKTNPRKTFRDCEYFSIKIGSVEFRF